MLSLITFIPLIGAIIVALMPKTAARPVALGASIVGFVVSLTALLSFNPAVPGYQFVESVQWIPQYGIGYKLGMDGISVWLVLLTTLIFPIAIWFSGDSIHTREKEYYALMLLMETATLGVFLSLDMFLFYVFWEFALVPMYFIIGVWGGERRIYASVKFFIYTMAGSALMLIAILAMGFSAGTFDLEAIAQNNGAFTANTLMFLAFFIAFAIKVPIFPFHTWLPDAHVEAPTAGSVILAAVLLKMGSYGLIRFNLQLFPEASRQLAPLIMALAVIGILYGAVVAFAQSDAKKLVAYSSVSHMGFIVLGIFALNQIGLQGALIQMVNHGLSTGGLFLIIGFLYERRHTREMARFGGLWAKMPLYGTLALIMVLASVGLPALNGFVGEFVILQGAFQVSPAAAAFAAVGMVLSAAYLLTFFQKVFLGESRDPANDALKDLNWREVLSVAPLIVLCFVIGLAATPFFNLMSSSVAGLLAGTGLAMR
jgi:NADH-quinone oxidoreductase subunit M